jgi:hypothetical protein
MVLVNREEREEIARTLRAPGEVCGFFRYGRDFV